MQELRFYNGATVWGKLDKFSFETTNNGKQFVEIYLTCHHAQYGNVRVLGRIWGKDAVDEFSGNVKAEKIKKGSDLRLEGNIQQYTGRDKVIKTTFNFYRVEPIALKEYKAAFRLTGEVVSFGGSAGKVDGFHPLKVRIIQEQKENFDPKDDVFEVCMPDVVMLEIASDPMPGETVRLKGYLEKPEDEFGDSGGEQRPIVRKLECFPNIGG